MVYKDGQELSSFEKLYYHRNELRVSSSFILGAKLNEKIESTVINNAITKLYDSRWKLRLNIFEEKGKYVVKELAAFPSSSISFMESNADQVTTLNQLHETTFKFGIQKTLWRIVVVNDQWIYLLCEHTLYDGTTAALIIEDLLKILNQVELTNDSNPSDDEFNQITKPSYLHLTSKIIETFAPAWVNSILQYFNPSPTEYDALQNGWIIEAEKKQTFHSEKHIISLSSDEFRKLKNLGSKHGVKFTSVWIHLNLIAFANLIQNLKLNENNVQLSIPFNLRSVLSANFQRTYGLLVSGVALNLIPPSSNVMDPKLLQYINNSLQKPNLLKACELIGMLNYVNPLDYLKTLVREPRSVTLEISNLGLIDVQSNYETHAKEFIFSQSNNLIGALISQSLASSPEKVNIVIEAAPEFQFFDGFIEEFEGVLRKTLAAL